MQELTFARTKYHIISTHNNNIYAKRSITQVVEKQKENVKTCLRHYTS